MIHIKKYRCPMCEWVETVDIRVNRGQICYCLKCGIHFGIIGEKSGNAICVYRHIDDNIIKIEDSFYTMDDYAIQELIDKKVIKLKIEKQDIVIISAETDKVVGTFINRGYLDN